MYANTSANRAAVLNAAGVVVVPAVAGSAGLLLSRDGGRIWERFGAGTWLKWSPTGFVIQDTKTEVKSPLAIVDPESRGAQLRTRQGLYLPEPEQAVCSAFPDFCAGDDVAFDLNAQPEYIESMSTISQSWQPCPGPNAPHYLNDGVDSGRVRGQLVATIAATWHNPMKPAQILSGVFVAAQSDDCNAANPQGTPGALIFRDTSNLVPTNWEVLFESDFGGLQTDNFAWRWDSDALVGPAQWYVAAPGMPYLKLPRFMSHPDAAAVEGDRCRMKYLTAAVAPSDSRVLYAWAQGVAVIGNSGHCVNSSGLWRSLNRGLSWHPDLVHADPQAQTIRA